MLGFLRRRTGGAAARRAAALADKGDAAAAFEVWREAAEAGDAESCYRTGLACLHGKGTLQFLPDARHWLQRAAEAGHADAQLQLARLLEHGDAHAPSDAARWFAAASRLDPDLAERRRKLMFPHGVDVPRDPESARRWAVKAAEQDKPEAQALAGYFFAQGVGGERDFVAARQWYERAAAHRIAWAELGLGAIYANALGVERDEAVATQWYRRAAQQDDVSACFALAVRILEGKSEATEAGEALRLLTKAADADHPAAQHRLALLMMAEEHGTKRDVTQIETRLRAAAKRGYLPAMLSLGEFFSRGQGIAPQLGEAAKWYRQAADLGDVGAQFMLGGFSARGEGVPKIMGEAFRWFAKAAEGGHGVAAFNLAVFYRDGIGCERDPATALLWFERAAQRGIKEAHAKIGLMRAHGIGTARDLPGALPFLERGAAEGDLEAITLLAAILHQGEGVDRDRNRATELLRSAAARGFAPAIRGLGQLYLAGSGEGLAPDAVSLEWFRAAAQAGDTEAAYVLGMILVEGLGVAEDKPAGAGWLELRGAVRPCRRALPAWRPPRDRDGRPSGSRGGLRLVRGRGRSRPHRGAVQRRRDVHAGPGPGQERRRGPRVVRARGGERPHGSPDGAGTPPHRRHRTAAGSRGCAPLVREGGDDRQPRRRSTAPADRRAPEGRRARTPRRGRMTRPGTPASARGRRCRRRRGTCYAEPESFVSVRW